MTHPVYHTLVLKDDSLLHGFVLSDTPEGILLACVEDFHLDGCMRVRRDTIQTLRKDDTDIFQEKILQKFDLVIPIPDLKEVSLEGAIERVYDHDTFAICDLTTEDRLFVQIFARDEEVVRGWEYKSDGTWAILPCSRKVAEIVAITRGGEYLETLSDAIPHKTADELKAFFADPKGEHFAYEEDLL